MNSTTGKLEVIRKTEKQYAIQHHPPTGDWDSCYFEVSGFFGTHKPELFAAAPDLYEALEGVMLNGIDDSNIGSVAAALSKARGETQ